MARDSDRPRLIAWDYSLELAWPRGIFSSDDRGGANIYNEAITRAIYALNFS